MRFAVPLALITMLAAPARAQEGPAEPYEETSSENGHPEDFELNAEVFDEEPPGLDVAALLERLDAARKTEFAKASYAFCHDEDWDSTWREHIQDDFCLIVDETSEAVCPRIRQICEPRAEAWWEELLPNVPPWVKRGVVIGVALVILAFFFRALYRRGLFETSPRAHLELDEAEEELLDWTQLPETPARAIIKRARRALEQGQVETALALLQVTCLRYFDDTDLSAFHPSKTNNEIIRAVKRKDTEWAALYREIANHTDRLRFGDGTTEIDAVRALLERLERALSVPRSGAGTALMGVVLALALAPGLTGCDVTGNPYYSHDADGLTSFRRLLESAGIEVEISHRPIEDLPPDAAVIVVRTTSARFANLEKLGFDDLLDAGHVVVVLDDAGLASSFVPGSKRPERGARILTPSSEWFCGLDMNLMDSWTGPGSIHGPPSSSLVLIPDAKTSSITQHELLTVPLLFSRREAEETVAVGAARLSQAGEALPGCMILFTSRDFFANAALTREANARFAVSFFAALLKEGERVVLLERLSASRNTGLAQSIAQSRMPPFIVHAGLWVALLFIALGAAFGVLRDKQTVHHKAFSEHVTAVGQHYAARGVLGRAHAAKALAKLVVLRHRHLVRGGHDGGWRALSTHLAEQHEIEEELVQAALRLGLETSTELGPRRAEDPHPASKEMLQALTRLLSRKTT